MAVSLLTPDPIPLGPVLGVAKISSSTILMLSVRFLLSVYLSMLCKFYVCAEIVKLLNI